ncbi:peptidylprolyl isomerase [Pseudidiomarina sp.]|uniref:peptidylprolyl isomerase n=1 Tax=Pseudidiomarina sp. TaxID=2081707 RepID=UPI00299D0670|nr:peptidylprolyl isomerase [Pseudidiomarina sp.]MDX1705027.1 peptidylprolyl isomerase [Pseudidiomarina sp.]
MLERIREGSQSITVKVILVLIALTFALAGIGGYISNTPEPTVAIVNGENITRAEFDRALDNERTRQQQQFGDFYDQLAADPAFNRRLRSQVLNDLVNQKLTEQYAFNQGLRVSDEQVKNAIRDIPSFRVAGQFDNETYQYSLRNLGYTPQMFAELMRRDMTRSQLLQTLVNSEFVLDSEVHAVQKLVNQSRSGRYARLALADYQDNVELTEADIEQWYQQNLNQFVVPEQVKAEFVVIDAGTIAEDLVIEEQTIQEWYEGNLSRYETSSQYRFSHILIEAEDGNEQARATAEQVLAELKAGADFAELAAQYSDDLFSAEQGGDLDWLEQGTMDPDFEEAAFALEEAGDITGVVETSFGFHIIKLTDKRPGSVTPLEEVRDEIVADIRDRRVKQAYYELQQRVAEMAFEIPDTLQPVAEETDLRVRSSDWFSRETAPSALNHPAVLEQVFNRDFIAEALNSDLIETSDTESVIVRVTDYQPQTTRPLDEVRTTVTDAVRTEKAQQLAQQAADDLVSQLRAGESVAAEMVVLNDVTRQATEHPRAIIQALFNQAAPGAGVAVTSTTLSNGDLAVVELTGVEAGEVTSDLAEQLTEQLSNSTAQELYAAFITALRADAEIEITIDQDVAQQ